MFRSKKASVLAAVGLVAMACPAHAQNVAPEAEKATQGLDIIVTATRREARAQDIPIAVSAYSAQDIAKANYRNPGDLQYVSPSVQVSTSGGSGFTVRGVGTNSFNAASEQTVGMVIDGIVYGFVDDIGADFSDIARVEVLRGPQGTQFGKNASAGVVNIMTERPTTDRIYGVGHFSYGSFNDTNASARLNLPLSDDLAMMVVGSYQNRDGWVYNPVKDKDEGDTHQYGVKAKFQWTPSPDFDAFVSIDYRNNYTSPNFLSTYRSLGIGNGAIPPGFGILDYGIVPGPENTQAGISSDAFRRTKTGGVSLEANLHLGDYTLTSLTAYRELNRNIYRTLGGTPIVFAEGPLKDENNQVSQELRLVSPTGGPVEFVGGLYYYRRHGKSAGLLAGDFGGLASLFYGEGARIADSGGEDHTRNTVTSFASYVDGRVSLTDKLKLIGGARLTYDKSSAHLSTVAVPDVYGPFGPVLNPAGSAKTDNTDFSWRIGAQYEFSPEVMVYATATRGYKGPLALPVAGSTPRIVAPETVRAYEAGIKSTLLDQRLLFNLTLFTQKFRNFQTSVLDTSLVPPQFVISNAGGMRSRGVELSVSARPVPALTFTADGTFQDAKFTDFRASCYSEYEPIGLPVTTDPDARGACYTVPGTSDSYIQAAGDPLPNASRWNVSLSAAYDQDLGDELKFDAVARYVYRSAFYTNGVDPNTRIGGYGIVNANIGLGAQDDSWRVGVFARNLFNTYYVAAIETGIFDTGGLTNVISPEARRTLGVVLDGRF
ncbi:TonB-dependent receptor [Novosphingobium pentaromativorans US6-1]|nr:TonB-dependent receptor [Novosphingobium pentaromativorans US6-1]